MATFQSIGVVHLLPLPGTPSASHSFDDICERALSDAKVIIEGGMSGLILENFGDAPFLSTNVPPHVPAMMSVILNQIRQCLGDVFLGVNVLRNDAQAALAVAAAAKADFIRINVHIGAAWTDQGLIQGQAYQTLLYRKQLNCPQIQIAADVLVKHAKAAGEDDLSLLLKDTSQRGKADIIILTGPRTGEQTSPHSIHLAKKILPESKIWVGSGITPENAHHYVHDADGGIIGSYLHPDGDTSAPLCIQRVREICKALSS